MHLIIRYHRPLSGQGTDELPPETDWLPSWRVDGPEEDPESGRGSSVSLMGETRLPVLPAGTVLQTREIYLDLRNPASGPFRSLDGQVAGEGNAYVARGELHAEFWDQLVRICARAGALVIDAARSGARFDVVLHLEPATQSAENELAALK